MYAGSGRWERMEARMVSGDGMSLLVGSGQSAAHDAAERVALGARIVRTDGGAEGLVEVGMRTAAGEVLLVGGTGDDGLGFGGIHVVPSWW